MNSDHVFNSVQWMNLQLLTLIHSGLQTDPVPTAYNFHLSTEQCSRILSMSFSDIQHLADNMASESLFLPRENFLQLLDAPAGLASILSAVRKQTPLGIAMGSKMHRAANCS